MGTFSLVMLVIGLAIGAIIGLATRKPDIFRVERRMVINAPPALIFERINTLRAWEDWSPWARKDPAMKQTYSGPAAGVGASQAWDGNKQVGTGVMTITDSVVDQRVTLRLDFLKPFKATNTAELELIPANGGTQVVWRMYGPAPLISKVMDLLMNMDRMIGRDFEAGLASLKGLVEPRA